MPNNTTDLRRELEQQRAETEQLREKVDELSEIVEDTGGINRRDVLGLGGLALAGLAGGGAAGNAIVDGARAGNGVAEGSIGTDDRPLEEIFVENLYANQEHLELDTLTVLDEIVADELDLDKLSSDVDADGHDATGFGSLSAGSLATTEGELWDRSENDIITNWSISIPDEIATTTADSALLDPISGLIADYENIPEGATLVGRFWARISSNSDDHEAHVTFSGRDLGPDDSVTYDELELTVQNSDFERVDTGWVEITSGPQSGLTVTNRFVAGVEDGGEFEVASIYNPHAGIAFGWRLD